METVIFGFGPAGFALAAAVAEVLGDVVALSVFLSDAQAVSSAVLESTRAKETDVAFILLIFFI
ncbi:hypothetical protein D3C84_842060 [compost metagenome]